MVPESHVGMAGGAVLSITGCLTSLVPAHFMPAAWDGQGYCPLLKVSPWCPNSECPAHRRLPLRQHWQTFLEGAASPPRNPVAVTPSVSLKCTGLPGPKLPMIRNGCLTKGSPFWRNSLSNTFTAVPSRTLAPRLAYHEV